MIARPDRPSGIQGAFHEPDSPRFQPARRRLTLLCAAAALVAAPSLTLNTTQAAESAVKIPAPAADATASATGPQTAVFAGGCFWGVQGVFQRVNGVIQAVSGYSGGAKETAQYEIVSTGMTGHAESVKITYDPKKVSYGTLLQIYFSVAHDPTQLNRQDPDSGTAVPLRRLLRRPGAEGDDREVHRPARCGQGLPEEDRHPGRAARGVLSRRGLPPGLPDAASRPRATSRASTSRRSPT